MPTQNEKESAFVAYSQNCRFLASLGMTKFIRYVPTQILFFAITTAPMMATNNSSDAISKGNM